MLAGSSHEVVEGPPTHYLRLFLAGWKTLTLSVKGIVAAKGEGCLKPGEHGRRSPPQLSARKTANAMNRREQQDRQEEIFAAGAVAATADAPELDEVRWLAAGGGVPREPEALGSGRNSWCRGCCVEAVRRWRAENPEKVAEANVARRVRERTFRCRECGRRFRSRRARLTCSEECRRERHRRFDRVRDHASRTRGLMLG